MNLEKRNTVKIKLLQSKQKWRLDKMKKLTKALFIFFGNVSFSICDGECFISKGD